MASPCLRADVVHLPFDTDLFASGTVYVAKDQSVPSTADLSSFKKSVLRVPRIDLRGGRYWLNVQVTTDSSQGQWALGNLGSYIERVELFAWSDGQLQHGVSGQFEKEDYPLHYGANFEMRPGHVYDLWILYDSRYFTGIPTAHVVPKVDYEHSVLLDNLLVIGCLGAIVILAAYNLLLSAWTKSLDYLFYAAYLTSTFVGWAAVFKIFVQTLGITHVSFILVPFFLNIVSNVFFYRHFLGIDQKYPWILRYGNAVAIVAALLAVLHWLLPSWMNYLLINLITAFWLTGGMVAGILRLYEGYKPARFYLVGFCCMTVGGALVVLPYLGMPRITQKEYLVTLVAQTFDVLFLAIALADRINIMRQEKSQALEYARDVDQKATQALLNANQKLSHALQVSEEGKRQKDQFIMAVSHELRTPLNAVCASLGQLSDTHDEKERGLLHQYIQFGADRLSSQVENLIMLAETDQQKIKPHLRSFSVDSLIKRISRLAEGYLFNKPVQFHIEKGNDVASRYNGDDYLLIRLLTPVLENACKFTEQGSVNVMIDVEENGLRFAVTDTGLGIGEDMQASLFESFTQASTGYARTYEGLGIGLTVCQRIAHLLGAVIDMHSTVGEGTRFTIHVPVQLSASTESDRVELVGGHALVVEDNEVNAKVLTAILKKFGFSFALAVNGLEALDRVKDDVFDIVLMDLQMPVMDGFMSAQNMRKQGIHCPIVAVTANSDYEARIRCLDVGMNDLLTKPINKELLKEKLLYWIPAR